MDKPENKKNDFLKTNLKWLAGVALAIIVLWLNSRYETKEEAAIHDENFDKLENEFGIYKLRLETLEGRFEKKLKILNKNTDNLNAIKIDIAVIETKIEKK